MSTRRQLLTLLMGAGLGACQRAPELSGPQYLDHPPEGNTLPSYAFAVHPLYNPMQLFAAYQPLIDHLNRHIREVRFELEGSADYQMYEAKIRAAGPQFLLPNPWQTLLAQRHGYNVIAEAGDSADFHGIFVLRQDSPILKFQDLKGRTVSYPSRTALAGCIMPQRHLHDQGLDVVHDTTSLYVGSQEAAIMHAYLGTSHIAATWPPPWRAFQKEHPARAAELRVIWETAPLINNSVMARQDVPPHVVRRVQELLLGLEDSPQGADILKAAETARFHPATNPSYDKVRDYVAAFERDVRPVENDQ
ncbi:MAG: hypothetical protein RJA44_1634 [Pseudomonadota bacterium]|jgi:phosphonate transport system substrate-binding protein